MDCLRVWCISSKVVRWSFLKKYAIVGRKKKKYRLLYFGKVIEHFSDIGSVSKKKRDRQSSKLAAAKVLVQSELEMECKSSFSCLFISYIVHNSVFVLSLAFDILIAFSSVRSGSSSIFSSNFLSLTPRTNMSFINDFR